MTDAQTRYAFTQLTREIKALKARNEELERLAAIVKEGLSRAEEYDGRGNACAVGSTIYRNEEEVFAIVGYRMLTPESRERWRWQVATVVERGDACWIADRPAPTPETAPTLAEQVARAMRRRDAAIAERRYLGRGDARDLDNQHADELASAQAEGGA